MTGNHNLLTPPKTSQDFHDPGIADELGERAVIRLQLANLGHKVGIAERWSRFRVEHDLRDEIVAKETAHSTRRGRRPPVPVSLNVFWALLEQHIARPSSNAATALF